MTTPTIQKSHSTSTLHRTIINRFDSLRFMSKIERWPDDNYAPLVLDAHWHETSGTWQLIASKCECRPEDVRVDLCGGNVIILISREQYGDTEEYYCEVSIPQNACSHTARIDIDAGHITVTLEKKRNLLQSLYSFLLPEPFGTTFKLDTTAKPVSSAPVAQTQIPPPVTNMHELQMLPNAGQPNIRHESQLR
jgi:HSP20 family molecular chaperone IbpA